MKSKRAASRPVQIVTLLVLLCLGGDVPMAAEPIFVDVRADVGVDFQHQDGRSGRKHYVETTASGGGFVDFDGDGDVDILLLNGAALPGSKFKERPRHALFENRAGAFVEVAEKAGIADTGYGMGLCTGDVDGDGHLDIMLTHYGPDRLYRSLGDGSFEEIGQEAGIADGRWSSSCALGDLDGDGDLDLYVTHYIDFRPESSPKCGTAKAAIYCHPTAFRGVADSLYLNQGRGQEVAVRFEEVGQARGLASGHEERGLGVLFSDLDVDGDLDIFVANDGSLNRLYVNDGRGHFEDQGLLSGLGLSALGRAEASMGVDVADVDGDGHLDLFVTHFAMETNTFYRGLGDLQFDDVTGRSGLGGPSIHWVGWGAQFLDMDLDGDPDLAVANGHMQEGIEALEPSLRYRQPNMLFRNDGSTFTPLVDDLWRKENVARGLAVADWNDDGRPDLLITRTNEEPLLLQNRLDTGAAWLGLVLRGPAPNRFAIGARVELVSGEKRQIREIRSGGSFQSQSDLRPLYGLGAHEGPVRVEIRWPNGKRQVAETAELNRYWTIAYRP